MAKSVTYNDLEGSAKFVEVGGVAFEDGKAIEVDDDELSAKLDGSKFFEVEGSTKKKLGRPPNKPAEAPKPVEPAKVVEPEPQRPLSVLAAKETE
jgi:hypothetical protein